MELSHFSVLLVEDDPDDVHFTERAFSKAGLASPLVVRDGEEAVDYLSGKGMFEDRSRFPLPLLILLDLKLPRRSGHEVLAWLKGQPGLRRIPVIVLTSSRETADVNRAFDLGASSYLAKPVETAGLVSVACALREYWVGLNRFPEITGPRVA